MVGCNGGGAGKRAEGPAGATGGAAGGFAVGAAASVFFFDVGTWTRLRAILFPNTTRASPICSSVPRIETWRSSREPSAKT